MKILFVSILLFISACSSGPTKDSKKNAAKKSSKSMGTPATAKKVVKEPVSPARYEATTSQLTCTLNNDVRSITASRLDNGGCVVDYEKFGETRQVAKAVSDISYCEKVLNRIKNNLEKNSFSCE